jgi:hypothetical protein
MKNIILIFLLILSISCKAQSPILPLYDNSNYGEVNGAYYKDINHFHTQFVGTWIYTNGTTSLKVIFRENNIFPATSPSKDTSFYEDYLVGEYQYIENGIEKTNSLNTVNNNHTSIFDYNMYSITRSKHNTYPKCNDCPAGTERLRLRFNEPTRRYGGPRLIDGYGPKAEFIIRKVIEGGVIKLKVQFSKTMPALDAPSAELENFSLPYGDYTLIKQ